MIAIDVMRTLCSIDRQIDYLHSQQVWVSGYKTRWNNQITPIFINTSAYTMCTHVMGTFCSIGLKIDWIHSQQVWVSGYKPQRNNQMSPIFMEHYQIWLPLM